MIAQCGMYMRRQDRVGPGRRQHDRSRQMVGIVEQRRHIDQSERRQKDQAQQGERATSSRDLRQKLPPRTLAAEERQEGG